MNGALMKGPSKLFQELRRRNVFRATAAYLVLVWLVVQVADVVLETFAAPVWVMQFVIVGSVIGFPIALGLSWYYEITDSGLKRTEDVSPGESISARTGRQLDFAIIGVLAAALSMSLYANFRMQPGGPDVYTVQNPSIAITRFANLTGDNEQIGLGISEELLNRLSRVPGIEIISTAVVPDAGQQVGAAGETADFIFHGSLRQLGDTLQIAARLTGGVSGQMVWSGEIEGARAGGVDEQRRIARHLKDSLVGVVRYVTRNGSERLDARAVEYYALGEEARSGSSMDDYQRALDEFQKSLTAQPDFAPSMLGLCRTSLNMYTHTVDPEYFDAVETHCNAALDRNPTLVQARETLGEFYNKQGDYERAEAVLEIATEKSPQYEPVQYHLAYAKEKLGKLDEAELGFQRSIVLEPESRWTYLAYGNFLIRRQRYDEAITQFKKIVEIVPDWFVGHGSVGATYLETGEYALALEYSLASAALNENDRTYANIANAYGGLKDDANTIAAFEKSIELNPNNYRTLMDLGDVYHRAGQAERALGLYENAKDIIRSLVEINPSDGYYTSHYAVLMAQTGDLEGARLEIGKALGLDPDNAKIRYNAGKIFHALGERERAVSEMRAALEGGYSTILFMNDDVPDEIVDDPTIRALLPEG